MALITTKLYTEPKPQRGLDYCGQPMKDGCDYYGNPITDQNAPQSSGNAVPTRPDSKADSGAQLSPKHKDYWTPARRAEIAAKVKAYWQRKRAADTVSVATPSNDQAG